MNFDMQKARRYADTGDLMKTTKWLYHALDEIDRQTKRVSALEQKLLTSECREREAMRRIAELEGNSLRSDELDEIRLDAKTEYALSLSPEDWRRDLRVLLAHCDYLNRAWADDVRSHLEIEDKQRAALKKLGQAKRERGKALVEERAHVIECNPNRTIEWTREQAKERAREKLHPEGRI
jgi:hypothetical protein